MEAARRGLRGPTWYEIVFPGRVQDGGAIVTGGPISILGGRMMGSLENREGILQGRPQPAQGEQPPCKGYAAWRSAGRRPRATFDSLLVPGLRKLRRGS